MGEDEMSERERSPENSKRTRDKKWRKEKSRQRRKIMNAEKNRGRTKSALQQTKYFTESPAYRHKLPEWEHNTMYCTLSA